MCENCVYGNHSERSDSLNQWVVVFGGNGMFSALHPWLWRWLVEYFIPPHLQLQKTYMKNKMECDWKFSWSLFNSLEFEQSGLHYSDTIFNCIFTWSLGAPLKSQSLSGLVISIFFCLLNMKFLMIWTKCPNPPAQPPVLLAPGHPAYVEPRIM